MLPPETEDNIVEVSLKHIVFGLSAVLAGTVVIAAGIFLVRDHIRYKRQKIFFESISTLLHSLTFKNERSKSGDKTQI